MNDAPPPDFNEESFAEFLQPGFRELRQQRGPCPTHEELVAFFSGRLGAEDASRVRSHVEACGLCDVELGRLNAAGEARRPGPLRAVWLVLRNPLVPYGLLALLCFPAYRGLVRPAHNVLNTSRGTIDQPPGSQLDMVPIQNIALDIVRSEGQAQKPPLIRLSDEPQFFLLSFFIPLRSSPPYRYEVVVFGRGEVPVAPPQGLTRCDAVGNCFLLCNSTLFSPGEYQLRVTESAPSGATKITAFSFQITR